MRWSVAAIWNQDHRRDHTYPVNFDGNNSMQRCLGNAIVQRSEGQDYLADDVYGAAQ